jgi:hypothetical protein
MAVCTGCGIDSKDITDYTTDDPVENDGTFFDNQFVCDACYTRLIDMREGSFRPDIGSALQIQENAREILNKANK